MKIFRQLAIWFSVILLVSCSRQQYVQLTHSRDPDLGGAWSPDSEILLIDTLRDEQVRILEFRKDRHRPQRWETAFSSIREPAWSPDGRWIAFVHYEGSYEELWIQDVATEQISLLAAGLSLFDPAWSPDNSRLVFSKRYTNKPKPTHDLYIVNIDNGYEVKITEGSSNDISPEWSPDGKTIVFASSETGEEYSIYFIDPDGGNLRDALDGGLKGSSPFWFPGGKRLGYISAVKDRTEIMVMDIETGRIQQLTRNRLNETNPSLSPNGKILAFSSNSHNKSEHNYDVFLFSLNRGTPIGFRPEPRRYFR